MKLDALFAGEEAEARRVSRTCPRSCSLEAEPLNIVPWPTSSPSSVLPWALEVPLDGPHQQAPCSLAPDGVWPRGTLPGEGKVRGGAWSLARRLPCPGAGNCPHPLLLCWGPQLLWVALSRFQQMLPTVPSPKDLLSLLIFLHSVHTFIGGRHLFPAGPWVGKASRHHS